MNTLGKTAVAELTSQVTAACQQLIARIGEVRESIGSEFREILHGNDRLLQLALNEAEALAWQTPYPHLVFPTLALEKTQAVANWDTHQRAIRRMDSVLSRAA